MKLDRETVVAEAIAQMNEHGLAEVSLRKVAARLGVKAPSLAWHVGDKDDLLGLMSATLFRSALDAVPDCATWEDWLTAFGRALWKVQNGARDAARLIASAPLPGEASEIIAEINARLRAAGAPAELAERMQSSVQALISGWTLFRQSVSGPAIERLIPIDASVEDSLAAVVGGWRERVAQI